MVFKAVLLLLVLTLSQVIATPVFQLRSLDSLEILQVRGGNKPFCPECKEANDTITLLCHNPEPYYGCVCGAFASVQQCIDCDRSNITASEGFVNLYEKVCHTQLTLPWTPPSGTRTPPSSTRKS